MFPSATPFLRRLAIVTAIAFAATVAFGQVLRDGAVYVGTWGDDTTVSVEVLVHDDARATIRVRSEPTPHGTSAGPHFDFEADVTWGAGMLRVVGERRVWQDAVGLQDVRPADAPERPIAVRMEAVVRDDRMLDPFGSAVLTLDGAPTSDSGHGRAILRLEAAGTVFHSRTELSDGTLHVMRLAPLFYAEPWRSLDLAGRVWASVPEALGAGLAQRRELPESVAGFWSDELSAQVMSLGDAIVSVLYSTYSYRGGAHPNTATWSETFLWTEGGWRVAELCEALGALAWPCPEQQLREAVIASLRSQEAVWVVQGEVGAETPWLLDGFTLTAAGLRFDFSPYEVGPYAQGPFVVRVPFEDLAGP